MPGLALAGAVIGTLSAIFGIGGGSMTVPFLSACRLRMQQAVAISAACGLPIAIGGITGFIIAGWQHPATCRRQRRLRVSAGGGRYSADQLSAGPASVPGWLTGCRQRP
jgi:uncharacterized membrane protein YfcA